MSEIIFLVEESHEGGYTARALGASIFTEADDWHELQANVRDAVSCHFESSEAPALIRLHFVREEVLTL
ncbi:MAG: 2-oxoisovalerate dehydrogenase [Isosphaeraceae bacterium]